MTWELASPDIYDETITTMVEVLLVIVVEASLSMVTVVKVNE
jgi:hypothetical protein